MGVPFGESKLLPEGKDEVIIPGVLNNVYYRDLVNAVFYMELGKKHKVKMYLGGNFPQMNNAELENRMADFMEESYGEYYRFGTFFHLKAAENLIYVSAIRRNHES